MDQPRRSDRGARTLLMVASSIILIAGLKAAGTVLVPFLISVFIAMISLPLLNWLQDRKVPSFLAVLATVFAFILVLVVLAAAVGGSIQGFNRAVPKYRASLQQKAGSVIEWLQSKGLDVSQYVATGGAEPSAAGGADEAPGTTGSPGPGRMALDDPALGDRLLFKVDPGHALDLVRRTLSGAATVLSNTVLVFLTIIFILSEAAGFPAKLERAFGRSTRSSERFETIKREILQYLGVKTVISLTTGLVIWTAMWLVGVDFPVLWGLLAFMLNYIPSLGSILAAVPPTLLAIVQFGYGRALVVAAIFMAVNMVLGNFVEPQFMGRRLGLSTLVVFLSLVFWGWVWGPVGMLLSVPLTMVVKIMLENTEDLRWVAVLLDANPPKAET